MEAEREDAGAERAQTIGVLPSPPGSELCSSERQICSEIMLIVNILVRLLRA